LKQHKKEVISYIESEAKKGINGGEIHIGDISVGLVTLSQGSLLQ